MALRISLDGMQPESCVLLEQFVRVTRESATCWDGSRVARRAESPGDAGTASAALRAAANNAEDWTPGELRFAAARDGESIELRYARPLGEARLEGSVELRPYLAGGAAVTEAAVWTLILWFGLLSLRAAEAVRWWLTGFELAVLALAAVLIVRRRTLIGFHPVARAVGRNRRVGVGAGVAGDFGRSAADAAVPPRLGGELRGIFR